MKKFLILTIALFIGIFICGTVLATAIPTVVPPSVAVPGTTQESVQNSVTSPGDNRGIVSMPSIPLNENLFDVKVEEGKVAGSLFSETYNTT